MLITVTPIAFVTAAKGVVALVVVVLMSWITQALLPATTTLTDASRPCPLVTRVAVVMVVDRTAPWTLK